MKIASVAEVKSQLSSYLKASEGGPVVVTRNGKAVAMIVGVHDDDEVERMLMAHSPKLQAILNRSRQQIERGETLTHDEVWSGVANLPKSKQGASSKQATKKNRKKSSA